MSNFFQQLLVGSPEFINTFIQFRKMQHYRAFDIADDLTTEKGGGT
jgi:hypothetical protein